LASGERIGDWWYASRRDILSANSNNKRGIDASTSASSFVKSWRK
jgi:hypothetical protein